jgi:hypothetical protein
MDNVKECQASKCMPQCGRHSFFILATAAAIIFCFEVVAHSLLLVLDYADMRPDIWLSLETISNTMMGWIIAKQALLAILATCIFSKYYKGDGMRGGIRFGLYFGLLLGLAGSGSYLYLPIPINISLKWLASGVLEGLCVGIAIAIVSIVLPKNPQA